MVGIQFADQTNYIQAKKQMLYFGSFWRKKKKSFSDRPSILLISG